MKNIRIGVSAFSFFLVLFGSTFVFAATITNGVQFVDLKDGAKVNSPLKVKMEVVGKKVAQAGDMTPNTGHFHILIDQPLVEAGKVIIADENHLHYGKGQTEAEVKLTPGKHTLTLVFADGLHLSFGKDWSETVTVVVE